jgi:hypothetical protein
MRWLLFAAVAIVLLPLGLIFGMLLATLCALFGLAWVIGALWTRWIYRH